MIPNLLSLILLTRYLPKETDFEEDNVEFDKKEPGDS
jgi:hypothetical protein